MNTNEQVEGLTNSLKHVKNAKASLERRLNDRRNKRKDVEGVLETVNAKLSHVKDLHSKMMEISKVAQHKVIQSQAQSDKIEENNRQKREYLKKIEEQFKEEESNRTNDMKKFEEELSKLSRSLIDAKKFYEEHAIMENISLSKKKCEQLSKESGDLDTEECELNQRLESLGISLSEIDYVDIDKENVWSIVSDEQRRLVNYLESLNKEIQGKQQALTNEK